MLKIGLSSCLFGTECRYDGGHKRDDFVVDRLSKYAEFSLYCPEDELFSHPRESLRLLLEDGEIRVVGNSSKKDVTKGLKDKSQELCNRIKLDDLDGFVLKSKSPSCGLERVKLYLPNGMSTANVSGVFAKAIADSLPLLPLEEEGRLQDMWLRENFLMRVYAYFDVKNLQKNSSKLAEIIDFHTSYKYLILSKSQKHYKLLGKVVANGQNLPFKEVLDSYFLLFCEAISLKSSKGKTLNVLEHMAGFFKNELTKGEKKEIQKSFEEFKDGIIPLIVPIKLLELYINKHEISYLQNQKFLNPYPSELGLRSDIKAYK